MKMLYEPKGAAREFASYAVNVSLTCPHGCVYCYCPSMLHVTRNAFTGPTTGKDHWYEQLEKDLKRLGVLPSPIFLSFVGDPFGDDVAAECTAAAVDLIHKSGNRVRILTKGLVPTWFWPHVWRGDEFGVTLTCDSFQRTRLWEPGTADTHDRISNLKRARDRRITTWVSCEPVIDPAWTLELIERAAPEVDVFAVGCANHLGRWAWPSPEEKSRVAAIDWHEFMSDVLPVLVCVVKQGKQVYLKRDLLKAAGVEKSYTGPVDLDAAFDAPKERTDHV